MKVVDQMKLTTLAYIEKNNQYLMLHRNKKINDENKNKWIGIGGKFNMNETPLECMKREVLEETGLTVIDYKYHGVVTFMSNQYETEMMHLFVVTSFLGQEAKTDEGELKWINKYDLLNYPMWQGDIIFLKLLEQDHPFFKLLLKYQDDSLIEAKLDDHKLDLEVWLK
jgi:8-oxo-dGTP diphosphatase